MVREGVFVLCVCVWGGITNEALLFIDSELKAPAGL